MKKKSSRDPDVDCVLVRSGSSRYCSCQNLSENAKYAERRTGTDRDT